MQWIWGASDGALKPINVPQVDQERRDAPTNMFRLDTGARPHLLEDGSPRGILGKDNLPSHLFFFFFPFAALPRRAFLQTSSLCSLHV